MSNVAGHTGANRARACGFADRKGKYHMMQIILEQALQIVAEGGRVFLLTQMTDDTTIHDLNACDGFVIPGEGIYRTLEERREAATDDGEAD